MNKAQLLVTTGIDLIFFMTIVYYAGGLVTRVEALERSAVPESKVAVLENKLENQNKQLERMEEKLDRAVNAILEYEARNRAKK